MSSMIRTLRRNVVRIHSSPILRRRAAYELVRRKDKSVLRPREEGIGAWLNRLRARFAPEAESVLSAAILRNREQELASERARAERHRAGVRAA